MKEAWEGDKAQANTQMGPLGTTLVIPISACYYLELRNAILIS